MSRTCNCVVGDKKLYDIVVRKYLGKQSHIIRGPFDKFVDSPYYSESELCGGAVTVSFAK